jgi:hypothetical protein
VDEAGNLALVQIPEEEARHRKPVVSSRWSVVRCQSIPSLDWTRWVLRLASVFWTLTGAGESSV